MVDRSADQDAVRALLSDFPIVALIGPRQVGKSTLARAIAATWIGPTHVFDLEDNADLARLDDATTALRTLDGLVVIDEIQRRPELFPTLRVLADVGPATRRFLVLGSAAPELLRQSSESLAGRIAYHDLGGFQLDETGIETLEKLWIRGGFPRSFTASSEPSSMRWRTEFIRTFVERDVPQLGFTVNATQVERLWAMLAALHGDLLNVAELGRSLGVSEAVIRRHLDILEGALVIRRLLPWHENLTKRQVKSPRLYVSDTGLLHALLQLPDLRAVERHPKLGASWEWFAMQAVIRRLGATKRETWFWRTQQGAELDLLVVRGGVRRGFEIKRTDAPAVTPSMRHALEDLKLESIDVIHAGDTTYPLTPRIRALAITDVLRELAPQ